MKTVDKMMHLQKGKALNILVEHTFYNFILYDLYPLLCCVCIMKVKGRVFLELQMSQED